MLDYNVGSCFNHHLFVMECFNGTSILKRRDNEIQAHFFHFRIMARPATHFDPGTEAYNISKIDPVEGFWYSRVRG